MWWRNPQRDASSGPPSFTSSAAGTLPLSRVGDHLLRAGIVRASRNELEPRALAITPAELPGRPSIREDDVGSEVVRAANEGRADAVGVDRHAAGLELADLLDG